MLREADALDGFWSRSFLTRHRQCIVFLVLKSREAEYDSPDQPSTTQSVSWPFEVSKFTPTRVTGRPLSAKRLR